MRMLPIGTLRHAAFAPFFRGSGVLLRASGSANANESAAAIERSALPEVSQGHLPEIRAARRNI